MVNHPRVNTNVNHQWVDSPLGCIPFFVTTRVPTVTFVQQSKTNTAQSAAPGNTAGKNKSPPSSMPRGNTAEQYHCKLLFTIPSSMPYGIMQNKKTITTRSLTPQCKSTRPSMPHGKYCGARQLYTTLPNPSMTCDIAASCL